MRLIPGTAIAFIFAFTLPSQAQNWGYGSEKGQWEAGGAFGYGFFQNASLESPTGKAKAGFSNGVTFSVLGGQDLYRYVGGEFRYSYASSDLKLSSGGQSVGMEGDSHTFNYDFLFYAMPRKSRTRIFGAAGAGGRFYRGTGAEHAFQPLNSIAFLTHTNQWEPVISFGGGIKYSVTEHVLIRVDFRDFATPLPDRLIAPLRGVSTHGWLHDLTPMFGISAKF